MSIISNTNLKLERIEISGVVQGVGFRPFVYRLAQEHGMCGFVRNGPTGVIIEAEGNPGQIDAFVNEVYRQAPALARISDLKRRVISLNSGIRTYQRFEIRESAHDGRPDTIVPSDVCICQDCLRELFDPHDRRYLYPFINCTNCGPRFTIVKDLPYDRPLTTMASFTMCPDCQGEYNNPYDRRFHAQPNACPVCGPQVGLVDRGGQAIPGEQIVSAIRLLRDGGVVAVKGLGGFHLAVDATNDEAVRRLRRRKHREEKPLALMAPNLDVARRLVLLDDATPPQAGLASPTRPIMLTLRREDVPQHLKVADSVAPLNSRLGVMLPYTPLHYLLFYHPEAGGDYHRQRPTFSSLVMTSGNIAEEPIIKDNDEAIRTLSGIADVFLVHNRDIHVRCDDSVVSAVNGKIYPIRRSRGYAPAPVILPEPLPQILAFGGELKNTMCLTDGRKAYLSQHIGDLENVPTLEFFQEAVSHFLKINQLQPHVFAYDLHPEYLSTKYCLKLLDLPGLQGNTAIGVQHHHAHIASVMAEHGCTGPVIGLAMDGTGYGLDGTIWGGEILICRPDTFRRFAHLEYMSMPGGARAVREPWRMAFSYLLAAFGSDWRTLKLHCLQQVTENNLDVLHRALAEDLHPVRTSSLGRLFDAVASILDVRHYNSFEGQAPMMLEYCAERGESSRILPYEVHSAQVKEYTEYPVVIGRTASHRNTNLELTESFVIDYKPTIRAIVEMHDIGVPVADTAVAFHNTLLDSFLNITLKAREVTGIQTVALSGGSWQNRILIRRFEEMLAGAGLDFITNLQVPVNDGGLSLGQAYVGGMTANAMGAM